MAASEIARLISATRAAVGRPRETVGALSTNASARGNATSCQIFRAAALT
jgi:hypothetical protein